MIIKSRVEQRTNQSISDIVKLFHNKIEENYIYTVQENKKNINIKFFILIASKSFRFYFI